MNRADNSEAVRQFADIMGSHRDLLALEAAVQEVCGADGLELTRGSWPDEQRRLLKLEEYFFDEMGCDAREKDMEHLRSLGFHGLDDEVVT